MLIFKFNYCAYNLRLDAIYMASLQHLTVYIFLNGWILGHSESRSTWSKLMTTLFGQKDDIDNN